MEVFEVCGNTRSCCGELGWAHFVATQPRQCELRSSCWKGLEIGNTKTKILTTVTSEDLEDLFGKFGSVENVRLGRGYSVIEFGSKDVASAAIEEMHGTEFRGEKLTVEPARPEKTGPDGAPRVGGGLRRGNGFRVLFENLPTDVSWQDLKDFVRDAGVDVPYTDVPRRRDGRGAAEFMTREDMELIISKMDGTTIRGAVVSVKEDDGTGAPFNPPREDFGGRRGGGGRGGGYRGGRGRDDYERGGGRYGRDDDRGYGRDYDRYGDRERGGGYRGGRGGYDSGPRGYDRGYDRGGYGAPRDGYDDGPRGYGSAPSRGGYDRDRGYDRGYDRGDRGDRGYDRGYGGRGRGGDRGERGYRSRGHGRDDPRRPSRDEYSGAGATDAVEPPRDEYRDEYRRPADDYDDGKRERSRSPVRVRDGGDGDGAAW